MNLQKMFVAQKKLRKRIGYQGSDRFEKSILALLVEIGECANEQRSWKYWSKDLEPRIKAVRQGKTHSGFPARHLETHNPLLEEYVDGLALVFDLGIEVAEEIMFDVSQYFEGVEREINRDSQNKTTITEQFLEVFYLVSTIDYDFDFPYLFASYYRLGELLGFTWEQIEQAFFEKNAINHARQEEGY